MSLNEQKHKKVFLHIKYEEIKISLFLDSWMDESHKKFQQFPYSTHMSYFLPFEGSVVSTPCEILYIAHKYHMSQQVIIHYYLLHKQPIDFFFVIQMMISGTL